MNRFCCEGALIDTEENRVRTEDLNSLRQAMTDGIILEQRAIAFDKEKNLIVRLGNTKGIIPYSECSLGTANGTARDISIISRVGKPVCFIITDFVETEYGETVALLSRRAVQEAYYTSTLAYLRPGDIINCRVTHIEPFGCFCDVGCGISALLPLDFISVSRIKHPSERIYNGMELRCIVRSVDPLGRLLLTHRELLGTWEENAALFSAGETVYGTVRSIESYGVFIELTPNLTGLAESRPGVRVGQHAAVFIKGMNPEKMKVKLVLIDAVDDPAPPAPFKYFIKEGPIYRWRYSPEGCTRTVERVFREE